MALTGSAERLEAQATQGTVTLHVSSEERHPVPDATVLAALLAELGAIERGSRRNGWLPELIGRLVTALRIISGYALLRPAAGYASIQPPPLTASSSPPTAVWPAADFPCGVARLRLA